MTPLTHLNTLTLSAGPRLLRSAWLPGARAEAGSTRARGRWVQENVAGQASEFLLRPVELSDEARLADVLGLLTREPQLCTLFHENYAQELCEEAALGPLAQASPGPLSIEYLELCQQWQFNSSTQEYCREPLFYLRGFGPVAEEDVFQDGELMCRKGERIEWSLSLSPVRELLMLPLRVKPNVVVTESDIDSCRYGSVLREETGSELSLVELLRSVCRGLSVYGSPQETREVTQMLQDRVNEARRQEQESPESAPAGKPLQDVFEQLGFAPRKVTYAKFFDNLDELDEEALARALRAVEDEAPAQAALERELSMPVQLKGPWRSVGGRALRKAIREARERSLR